METYLILSMFFDLMKFVDRQEKHISFPKLTWALSRCYRLTTLLRDNWVFKF